MVNRSPTQTVTLLFTDIEGSTRLWEQHPLAMHDALELHNGVVGRAITSRGGVLFYSGGDSIGAAFDNPADAIAAAVALQEDLAKADWGEVGSISVRVGLDTGLVEVQAGDYLGPPVNRAARVLDQASGGEILLTSTTADLVRHRLPDGVTLNDRGAKTLAGVSDPVRVYGVGTTGVIQRRRPIRMVVLGGGVVLVAAVTLVVIGLTVIRADPDEEEGTAATSVATTLAEDPTATEAPDALWQFSTPGRPSPPLIDGNVVYVGAEGSNSGSVAAIDLQTGDVLWESDTGSAVRFAPVEHGGLIYITRASSASGVGDDFVSSDFAGVVALDAETGQPIAECLVDGSAPGPLADLDTRLYVALGNGLYVFPVEPAAVDRCEHQSTPEAPTVGPVAAGGRVFIGTGSIASAFSSDSLSEVWQSDLGVGQPLSDCAALDWMDALLRQVRGQGSINNELLLFARDWEGRLYRLSGETGIATHTDIGPSYGDECGGLFTVVVPGFRPPIRGRPLLTEDAIYVPTFDGQLAALGLDTLEVLWEVPVGAIEVGPATDGEMLYVVTDDGTLRAVDIRRRTEAWSRQISEDAVALAAANGIVIVASREGVTAYSAP